MGRIVIMPIKLDLSKVFITASVVFQQMADVTAVECLKDEALGEVDGNKYYCEDESKPECCEMNESFTCCELDSVKNMKEQLQLWGAVMAVVIVLVLIVFCFRKDVNYCHCNKTIKDRLMESRARKNKDISTIPTTTPEPGEIRSQAQKKYNNVENQKKYLNTTRPSTSGTVLSYDTGSVASFRENDLYCERDAGRYHRNTNESHF